MFELLVKRLILDTTLGGTIPNLYIDRGVREVYISFIHVFRVFPKFVTFRFCPYVTRGYDLFVLLG